MRPANEPDTITNIQCIYHWVVGGKRVFNEGFKGGGKKNKKIITTALHVPLSEEIPWDKEPHLQ